MKKGYVRIPTVGPMPTWEKVMMWLLSILMAVACIGTSIAVTRSNTWNWHSYALVGLLGVTSLSIAVWLSSDSDRTKALLWLVGGVIFYGLCVWFGGLSGWLSRPFLFFAGFAMSGCVFFSDKDHPKHAVPNVLAWLVWLVPFVITRQHWWKNVGYFFGGLLGAAIILVVGAMIVKGGFLGACGRLAKRLWNTGVAKPSKFVYTVLVGHPRYWYKVEDHLEFTESSSKMNKAAFQPAYIYLPFGGIFRRCRITWPGNHWRIERERLGCGYRIVDREGGALALRVSRAWLSLACTAFGPGSGTYSRPVLIIGQDNREVEINAKEADQIIAHIFDRETVTCVLDGLRLESVSLKDKISRLEFSASVAKREQAEHLAQHHAQEAVRRRELARKLAHVTALVKTAPKNKKLGTVRHELMGLIQELVGDEKLAKAMLYDAQVALEQDEAGQTN